MSCPVCGKRVEKAYRPFCSARCANIDLGRWLNEDYAIPATSDDASETPLPPPGENPNNP